jgi:hypothetical protein
LFRVEAETGFFAFKNTSFITLFQAEAETGSPSEVSPTAALVFQARLCIVSLNLPAYMLTSQRARRKTPNGPFETVWGRFSRLVIVTSILFSPTPEQNVPLPGPEMVIHAHSESVSRRSIADPIVFAEKWPKWAKTNLYQT